MDTRVIYNLKTGTVASASADLPQLVWNNRIARWEIVFTGRRPDAAVASWRASVALDHLAAEEDTLARFDTVTVRADDSSGCVDGAVRGSGGREKFGSSDVPGGLRSRRGRPDARIP